VVASRVKDIAGAGGGSDAIANSELLWNDDFQQMSALVFPFCGRNTSYRRNPEVTHTDAKAHLM
jgi:hypothetical protein